MNRTLIPLALVLAIGSPAVASATTIDDRQERQAERIEKGRDNGSITWTEGIKLRAEQRRIARTEAALKADGYLSKSDRAELAKMQHEASQNIRSERNDGWHRLWGLPRVGK
jgi:hypothetical protein